MDQLNILTPTPVGPVVKVRLAHQAAIVQLAHFLRWPEVHHTRASGFTVHIGRSEHAWVQFAVDGRRKDQFGVLAWLAQQAHEAETEQLTDLPPLPYLSVAAPNEPVPGVPHQYAT